MSPPRALIKTLRPHQWVKNGFVAAALVFGKKILDPEARLLALGAVAAFCALSSAIYALNDVLDADKDRAHPVKRRRPIASGALSERTGVLAAGLLAAGGLGGAYLIDARFAAVAAGYLVLNLAYSLKLKALAFVDVACIATGFLLRVLAGAFAVDVPPSRWLLLCTLLLASYLGFGKRSHELGQALAAADPVDPRESLRKTRPVLLRYNLAHLRWALYGLGTLTVTAYALYTVAPHTIEFFGTRRMIWTAPFCLAGIARFLHLVTRRPHGDSPTEEMLRDPAFMVNLGMWGLAVLAIIYYR